MSLTPKELSLDGGSIWKEHTYSGESIDEMVQACLIEYAIPGTATLVETKTESRKYKVRVPVKDAESLHADRVSVVDAELGIHYSRQTLGQGRFHCSIHIELDERYTSHHRADVYVPVDQRRHEAEIDGTPFVFPNDDGTAFDFSFTRPGTHEDHEIALSAGTDGKFQPLFRQYQVDAIKAPNATAKALADRRFVLLSEFYGDVVSEALVLTRSRPLGHRHQDPHPSAGHVASEIRSAVATTKAKWRLTRATDLAELASGMRYIDDALTIPAPQTRHDIAQAAEKAAMGSGNGA